MRIGYLVPEFPGQTHIMFRRELVELRRRSLEVDVVSTRPPKGPPTHDWAAEASRETFYLYPPSLASLRAAASGIRHAGPRGVRDLLGAARTADGFSGARGRARLLAFAVAAASVAGRARARGWEHVHVHSCADAANIVMFASKLHRLPYSLSLHGGVDDYGGNQADKWRGASFGIVVTETLRQEVESRLGPVLPPRVLVAGMGVDPGTLRRTEPYRPWQPGTGRARIFSCGRLNPSKGHLDLIAALGTLCRAGVDAEVFIAGEDDDGGAGYRRVIERAAAAPDVAGRVHLLGAVPESEVRRQLNHAHAFALASRAEPLGVAIMEAMAMEVPIVVTRAGGVPELVEDGVTGSLVPPGDPEALAGALHRVLTDPDLARCRGREGRSTVVERYTSAQNASMLLEAIDGALAVSR
jgi:colanic acid/amylovoran biosynthesis glycosyltransferase